MLLLPPSDRPEDLQARDAVAPAQLGQARGVDPQVLHTGKCTGASRQGSTPGEDPEGCRIKGPNGR